MERVLILGTSGMLGSTVLKYMLSLKGFEVTFPISRVDVEPLITSNPPFDYIINAVGAIPQKTNDFSVNYELPAFILKNFKGRLIQPSTDCVFSGGIPAGNVYKKTDKMDAQDAYGQSKAIADKLILETDSSRFKILRTSIIGFDKESKSLLSWFLSQPDNTMVPGYMNAYWNGITTLEWAKFAVNMIKGWDHYNTLTQVSSRYVDTKYDLLQTFRKVFNKKTGVLVSKLDKPVNKALFGDIKSADIYDQLIELRNFYK